MGWPEAWQRASAMMKGVTRRRVRGSAPGVEIALLDWGGQGDLVLLHHANGFCGATLAAIANALSERFRVVSLDARGHGDSSLPSVGEDGDPHALTAFAADFRVAVCEILELVGGDRVELAIGHSLGGTIVLSAAEHEPALFEKVLLCDPVIHGLMTSEQNAARSRASGLAAAALRRRDRFSTREEAFEHFRSRKLFADFAPEALALYVGEGIGPTAEGDFALKCSREFEAAAFGDAAMIDLDTHADKITAEVLFLHALRGNFSRDRYDQLASRMPHARVESLDVGHLFPIEASERVLSAVDTLMKSA